MAGAADRPGAARPGLRQRARRQEALHPVGRGAASWSGLHQARALVPHRDVRAAALRHRGPVWPSERARHREPVLAIPQPEGCRAVRRAAARRGGQQAVRQACCPEPALRSAQVWSPVQVWLPGQARSGEPWVLLSEQQVLPPARGAPQDPLPEAASESGEPQAAVASARAAAEPPREAVLAAWEPDVPRAVPEAAVSERAAAALQPAAAKAASERQAAVGAAAVPGGPQVAAEAVAALQGAAVRQPAEAQRAGEAVQPRAAVPRGARAPQAARPLAVPSEAASVFRQGPSLVVAGPAQPRAAARFAHAMRSL